MHKKIIANFPEEYQIYENIKERSDGTFSHRIGAPCFEQVLIYPLQDEKLSQKLMDTQNEIRKILQDNTGFPIHFYPAPQDLHMTFLTVASAKTVPDNLEIYRNNAIKLFNIQPKFYPEIRFFGGNATQTAVIIRGYDLAELNNARMNLARLGIQKNLFSENQKFRYLTQVSEHNTVFPNIAHLSLIQFLQPVDKFVREKINELLNDVDFVGRSTRFPKIGLYEFDKFGVFSEGKELASRLLPTY